MFEKRTPLEKEWRQLLKKEKALLDKMEKAGDPFWDKKLKKVVPDKLQETLEAAFLKGFKVILTDGTGLLEKTYSKERLEAEFKTREYAQEVLPSRKNLTAAKKTAGRQTAKSVAGAGIEGAALGFLGIGLPDIVIFLGMLLRSLYTLALNYGIDYENEEEQKLLLDLLVLSLSRGKSVREQDAAVNRRLYEMAVGREISKETGKEISRETRRETGRESSRAINGGVNGSREPADRDCGDAMHRAAKALSGELLYLKFLQGIPVIGVIGGIYDGIYLKKITTYVSLKLERRYLLAKLERYCARSEQ